MWVEVVTITGLNFFYWDITDIKLLVSSEQHNGIVILYVTSPSLIYVIIGGLYLLTAFAHFANPPPLPLATTNLFSYLQVWFLVCLFVLIWFVCFKYPYMRKTIWYLLFLVKRISLRVMPSSSIHFAANCKILFYFLNAEWYPFVCVYSQDMLTT